MFNLYISCSYCTDRLLSHNSAEREPLPSHRDCCGRASFGGGRTISSSCPRRHLRREGAKTELVIFVHNATHTGSGATADFLGARGEFLVSIDSSQGASRAFFVMSHFDASVSNWRRPPKPCLRTICIPDSHPETCQTIAESFSISLVHNRRAVTHTIFTPTCCSTVVCIPLQQ